MLAPSRPLLFMKNFLLSALFIFVGTQVAFSQTSNEAGITANINVSAEVIQSIELITVNTISFGSAQPGQVEIYVNPLADLNSGYMIAVGTPNTDFRLNYLSERELTQIDGDGRLTFTYEISANMEEDQASSEVLEDDNRTLRFNASGRYYIWVGGRVNIENAQPGNYQGDFSIEIDYI